MKYIIALALFLLMVFNVSGQDYVIPESINQRLIVWLDQKVLIDDFLLQLNANKNTSHQYQHLKTLGRKHNIHLLELPPYSNKASALDHIRKHKSILQVQFDANTELRLEPNDLNYPEQWTFEKIDMPDAWELSTGGITINGDTIVIAILDSGFDITHPDLKDNVWYNHAEIPNDSIDNDNNGYIDDYVGWNFRDDSNEHGLSTHGHSVAGIIGARGNNNIGVTGINWHIKLMLLDTKTISSIIAAYEYIIDQRERYNASGGSEGAFVVSTNASWGIENQFCDEQPIIRDLYDVMGSYGILTAAATANSNYNVDLFGDFPSTCPSEYLLTVTNTVMNDEKYSNSAFGLTSVDMGVPGEDSYTLRLNDNYGNFGSNSAATPHLTGAIGLLYSLLCAEMATDALVHPEDIARQVRDALLNGVDPINALSAYTKTGGRLNVANSAELMLGSCMINIGPLSILEMNPNPTADLLKVFYQSPDFSEHIFWVHNSVGQLVFRDSFIPSMFNEKIYELDVTSFSAGVYTMSIQGSNRMVSKKFVVVK
jgi:subtilisin family serine protease